MDFLKEWLPTIWNFMNASKVAGALIIVAASAVLAWLVDLAVNRVLLAWARKSKFHLDDAILDILHKPIWISIILMGALTGVEWISPRAPFNFIIVAILKTFLVLIWALAFHSHSLKPIVKIGKDCFSNKMIGIFF